MSNKSFFLQLLGVAGVSALILLGLFQIASLAPYQMLGWISLGGFSLLSILMFLLGRSAANSANKNSFTNMVLLFTMGKMFFAVMIVYSYLVLAEPSDKFFVVPFFVIYFIFTAFETYFMMRLGKSSV
jgi:cobalamin synthase